MAIDPMQVLAMQQALAAAQAGGLPGAYGAAPQAYAGGQLAPQGFFGNLLGQLGQPLGGAIGGAFGQPQLGQQLGGIAGQLGQMLPFGVDPVTAAYAGGQLAPQGFGSFFRNVIRHAPTVINAGRQLGLFGVDPVTAAYAGGQLAPQGFFGNLLGQLGQPLGGAIGGAFGQPQLGQQLGGIAGQLGQMLPFGVDPVTAAYAGGQLAPQGILGNILGGIGGRALGGVVGGWLGNRRLGQLAGGIAGRGLGSIIPFQVDPLTAAYGGQLGPFGVDPLTAYAYAGG